MRKNLVAVALCLGLAACQHFYVLPAVGTGNANAPFVNFTPTVTSVTGGPSGGDACVAQSTKACVGCSVSCASNRQPACVQGKDAGPDTGGVAAPLCAQEARCRCE